MSGQQLIAPRTCTNNKGYFYVKPTRIHTPQLFQYGWCCLNSSKLLVNVIHFSKQCRTLMGYGRQLSLLFHSFIDKPQFSHHDTLALRSFVLIQQRLLGACHRQYRYSRFFFMFRYQTELSVKIWHQTRHGNVIRVLQTMARCIALWSNQQRNNLKKPKYFPRH